LSKEPTYDEIKAKYIDLQFRVTRFLATEQELINTKDKLDQELILYKRLSDFNTLAFKESNPEVFLQFVAEAIVDIFETEFGVVQLHGEPCQFKNHLFSEGAKGSDLTVYMNEMTEERVDQECLLNIGNIFLLKSKNESRKLKCWLKVQDVIVNEKCKISLFAAVTYTKSPLYSDLSEKQATLFNVFSKQASALLSNMLTLRENKEQLVRIAKSELELKKLSMIATKTKSGVVISDNRGRIEWVNESFENTTGYQLHEVIRKKPKDFLQIESPTNNDVRLKLSESLAKKEKVEVTVLNISKSGNPYYSLLEITPIFDEQGNHINFIALQKDITKEENYKNELIQINSRFEMITESSNIGIWELDSASNKISWNSIIKSWYEEELKYNSNANTIWINSIHPVDKDLTLSLFNKLKNGQITSSIHEYRVFTKKKGKIIIKSIVTAELDENRKIKRLFGSLMDVTDERNYNETLISKNTELQKINSELDQFVYSVSHDLRAPLLAIKGLISLIEFSIDNAVLVQQYSELIKTSVSRLDGTILEILDYSKNSRMDIVFESIDIKTLAQQIYNDLSHLTQEKIDFSISLEGNGIVVSDKNRLSTTLQNLIANSIKYKKKKIDNAFVKLVISHKNNEVQIDVVDNGEGLSEANQYKAFDMFFRASNSSPGTGLGLYICKEIITKLNGQIMLTSELGVGTTVRIILTQ
jgi:PAS domain S-box-containing protein